LYKYFFEYLVGNAKPTRRFSKVEFLKYVFNFRSVEKLRSAVAVDTGSMASIFSSW